MPRPTWATSFFHKTTKRRYRALVWGNVEQDEGTVTGNIGRNPRDRMQMTVLPEGEGKHAVTHYRVLERFGYVTLVECVLETGRTHQIRVHMKHIGHILFNDERYGGHEILKGTHFESINNSYKQLLRHLPAPGIARHDTGFRASGHRRGDALHLPLAR